MPISRCACRTGPAWAVYEVMPRRAREAPREVVAPSITTYEEAARGAPRPAVWAGELSDALAAARDAEGRTGDTIAAEPQMLRVPRAVAIVEIARARGAFGDPAGVDALYLRPPSITKPVQRPRER